MNDVTFNDVTALVVSTLGIEDRAASIGPSTPLLGAVPELDSMAVVELVTRMESHFGFQVDDADVNGEVFATFGSLADFVGSRRS